MEPFALHLEEAFNFTSGAIVSKVLVKTEAGDHTLFCLAAGTSISEHTSTREAVITVLKGKGLFRLADQEVSLRPGTFIFMPANTPHAVQAEEDLAFLLSVVGPRR